MSRAAWMKGFAAAVALGAGAAGAALWLTSDERRAEASVKASQPTPAPAIRVKADTGKAGAQSAGTKSAERPAARKLVNGARIGAWTVQCEAVAVGETVCALKQQLLRPSDRAFIAEIIAAWNANAGRPVLVARVPLGVHLPSGFVIQAKGDKQRNFEWQRCFGRFCEAALVLSPEDVTTLESAGEVVAAFRPAPGTNPFVFRFSMNGLSQGLLAIGADPAKLKGSNGTGKTEKKKK